MAAITSDELRDVPLFSGLNEDQLSIVSNFLTVESYRSGKSVVREGDVGYTFYIIKDGKAEVTQGSDVLRDLGPGDFFGEISIVSQDGKRTATVTARSALEVWSMLGTSFRQLQVEHPEIAATVKGAVDERLSSDR